MSETTAIAPNVTVNRKALATALQKLSKVVSRRTNKRVLANVLIERQAGSSWVTLAGTNLETTLKLWLKDDGAPWNADQSRFDTETARCLVNLEALTGAVRSGKSPECTIHVFPEHVVVNGGAVRHKIQTDLLKEYPPLGLEYAGRKFAFGTQRLAQAIKIGLVSAAKENTRYAINGILLEVKDGACHVVATDGRRLVSVYMGGEYEGEGECATILPRQACELIVQLVGKQADGAVHVYTQPQDAIVHHDGTKIEQADRLWLIGPDWLIATTCEYGHFPNYREVTPKESDNTSHYLLCARDLAEVIKQVAVATSEERKGVRTTFDAETGFVTVDAGSYTGEAEGAVACNFLGTGDLKVVTGFNPAYLLDICNTMSSKEMACYLRQNTCTFKGGNISQYPMLAKSTDNLVTWVLMPVQCDLKACPEHLGSNYVPPETCEKCGKELEDCACEEVVRDHHGRVVEEPACEPVAA